MFAVMGVAVNHGYLLMRVRNLDLMHLLIERVAVWIIDPFR